MNRKTDLTARSIIIGITGLTVVTVLSMYVALKMGALPWPTVFVTVLSAICLKKTKNVTLQEINCTHTLMSAGSMVAGGLAFTVPGLWIINPSLKMSFFSTAVIAMVGAVLGTVFININRKVFIEKQKLPYPIGQTAFSSLEAAFHGKGAALMFSSTAVSAVFTFFRDFLHFIPQVFRVFSASADGVFPSLFLYASPMALGIGSIIGTTLSFMWFLGMVIGYFVITPLGLKTELFPSIFYADEFRKNLGIGLMIGTGLGVVIKAIIDLIKKQNIKINADKKKIIILFWVCIICSLVLTFFTEIKFFQSLLIIPCVYVVSYLSGMLTGQTGINPMEIFAILVVLFIGIFTKTSIGSSFAIAGTVAVVAGISGDVMNDFKAGSLVGTNPFDQLKAETIGGVLGAIISVAVLFVLKNSFTIGGVDFPAPQAKAVSSMVNGLNNPISFYIGVFAGLVLFLLNVPAATLGLGVYLSTEITSSVALGSLLAFVVRKIFVKKGCNQNIINNRISLVSSGFLGGEGLCGVIIALIAIVIN